jgi:hypothetical protein
MDEATEIEYLQFFHGMADFGPADGDVRAWINEEFTRQTGKALPAGYQDESEE